MENELYILFLENRVKEVKLLHTNEIESNDELQAEIRELKADIKHDGKVCEDYDDDLIKEIEELKADNVKHYPKEYKAEADEWFEYNPHDEKLFFFMVGSSEIDEDGDITRTLNVGCDTIAEIDNMEVN